MNAPFNWQITIFLQETYLIKRNVFHDNPCALCYTLKSMHTKSDTGSILYFRYNGTMEGWLQKKELTVTSLDESRTSIVAIFMQGWISSVPVKESFSTLLLS